MTILDKLVGDDEEVKDNNAAAPIPARLQKNKRVMILTANNTQDLEFFYPYYRLTEEGYEVDVVTPEGGKFAGKYGLGLNVTKNIKEVRPQDYELLYIPGGKAPEELRRNDDVLKFVEAFAVLGKPIAAICHGPQVLVTAGLLHGRQIAAWPAVAQEIIDAGGTFVDEALVEDGQFITARRPGDLPRHLYGVLQYLAGKVPNQSRRERKASGAAA
jgi:protease I